VRTAFLVDEEISDYVAVLTASIIHECAGVQPFFAGPDYGRVVKEIRDRQNDFDCLIVFLRFANLCKEDNLFAGIRLPIIMLEHDAWMNFSAKNPYFGKWSDYLSKNKIDEIAVSGIHAYERLREEGFRSFYLPKGTPGHFLQHPNSYSGFVCMFGNTICWPGTYEPRTDLFDAIKPLGFLEKLEWKLGSRPRMVKTREIASFLSAPPSRLGPTLARMHQCLPRGAGRLPIHRLRFGHREMPEMLRLYSASVICDTGMHEPMMKHFEISGLGLAPIRDDEAKDELEALGYRDRESMILYSNAENLFEKLRHYAGNEDRLRPIQEKAREVARLNTWEIRAKTLLEHIESLL
jgi:hypothetical protein